MSKRVVASSIISSDDPQKFADLVNEAMREASKKNNAVQHMTHNLVCNQGDNPWSTKYYQSCIIAWEEADGSGTPG